jgi:hypothetical protein
MFSSNPRKRQEADRRLDVKDSIQFRTWTDAMWTEQRQRNHLPNFFQENFSSDGRSGLIFFSSKTKINHTRGMDVPDGIADLDAARAYIAKQHQQQLQEREKLERQKRKERQKREKLEQQLKVREEERMKDQEERMKEREEHVKLQAEFDELRKRSKDPTTDKGTKHPVAIRHHQPLAVDFMSHTLEIYFCPACCRSVYQGPVFLVRCRFLHRPRH